MEHPRRHAKVGKDGELRGSNWFDEDRLLPKKRKAKTTRKTRGGPQHCLPSKR